MCYDVLLDLAYPGGASYPGGQCTKQCVSNIVGSRDDALKLASAQVPLSTPMSLYATEIGTCVDDPASRDALAGFVLLCVWVGCLFCGLYYCTCAMCSYEPPRPPRYFHGSLDPRAPVPTPLPVLSVSPPSYTPPSEPSLSEPSLSDPPAYSDKGSLKDPLEYFAQAMDRFTNSVDTGETDDDDTSVTQV